MNDSDREAFDNANEIAASENAYYEEQRRKRSQYGSSQAYDPPLDPREARRTRANFKRAMRNLRKKPKDVTPSKLSIKNKIWVVVGGLLLLGVLVNNEDEKLVNDGQPFSDPKIELNSVPSALNEEESREAKRRAAEHGILLDEPE